MGQGCPEQGLILMIMVFDDNDYNNHDVETRPDEEQENIINCAVAVVQTRVRQLIVVQTKCWKFGNIINWNVPQTRLPNKIK